MMARKSPLWLLLGGVLAASPILSFSAEPHPEGEPSFTADQIAFFEKNVRPVLIENCYKCHEGHTAKNGLQLNTRASILRGSDYKKVVTPGDADNSVLIKAIRHAPGVEAMPHKKPKLADTQIEALAQWVKMGLPWPKEAVAHHDAPKWQDHWAFQPVRKPAVPAVQSAIRNPQSAIPNPVDAFVAAKLSNANLDFAPSADKATLGRRLYVTLTGLPPSYEQLQAFVNDKSPDAAKKLIDSLLDSPGYGERLGRLWLDVARYSDTEGYRAGGVDIRYPHAYTYRDWVVRALNADMPYDKFITLQLAADKVKPSSEAAPSPDLAALGFLTVNDTFLGDKLLQTDDRIDVIGRGLIGLTVSCARCHDHKYDPIPTKDFYALYSMLSSCEIPDVLPIIGESSDNAAQGAFKQKVADVEGKMRAFREEVYGEMRQPDRLRDYLLFAHKAANMEPEAFRGFAGKEKFRDRFAGKWREFLKAFAVSAKPHPVMLAWSEFAKLSEADFAAKSTEIAQRLAKPEGGGNPVLRNELAKRPAPKSMTDVASLYADVFLTCLSGQQPDNADWQQVRSLLQNPMSPMSVSVDGIENFFTRKDREHMTKFENEIKKLELNEPGAPQRAMVMVDKPQPNDVRVFIRGNPGRQGDPAPRAYLTMFGGEKFTQGSGRLELAQRIASKDNPLTARVIVNRVWTLHFGKPLVSQPSDFGVQTPKPDQAELLDWLAATFMDEGWSLKKLHRHILNSRTYQQSCTTTPEKDLKDPENNFLTRFTRQRLDYEQMRDAMLATSRMLEVAKMGGRSTTMDSADADSRRSLYLFINRYEQATVPAMFDFANPDQHSPQRFVTTVPQQALFLMNSPFLRKQASKIAESIPVQGSTIDSKSIKALYHRTLLRDPKPEEVELAQRFLNDATSLQEAPTFLWKYGAGKIQRDATGKITGLEFTPFTTYNASKSRTWWGMGNAIPDPKWSYVHWAANGGHPSKEHAAVLRWVSPFDGTIRITGELDRDNPNGNGVRGLIVSSRQGVVKDMLVPAGKKLPVAIGKLEVRKGEIIDFAVDCEGETSHDGFEWRPGIHRLDAHGNATLLTQSDKDFADASHWPPNRPRPTNALTQLAQVLLMSNEFQFVD
jgi:hypothetical protein